MPNEKYPCLFGGEAAAITSEHLVNRRSRSGASLKWHGMRSHWPARYALRHAGDDARKLAVRVGVDEVLFLRLPDGILEYGVELRRVLAKVVREQRPDVALTINFRETFGGTNLNQADHIAVGKALLDAVRDAGNRWIFPEQLTDVEPWGGVRAVWSGSSPGATHAVDVTETFQAGTRSIVQNKALVRRFIDPAAEFLYVPAAAVKNIAEQETATPYDVADVELENVQARVRRAQEEIFALHVAGIGSRRCARSARDPG